MCSENRRHTSILEPLNSRRPKGRLPVDIWPLCQMSSNPSRMRITREIKDGIWRKFDVCQEKRALVPVTGSRFLRSLGRPFLVIPAYLSILRICFRLSCQNYIFVTPREALTDRTLRAISCLMAMDGFSFTYYGDNDVW